MTQSTFGHRIKILMADRGMTATELAERSGITRQMVTNYVHGSAIPGLSTACKMASALGVSVDDLADGDVRDLITT